LRRVYHGFGVYERRRSESVEQKGRVHKAKWWGWCPMWSKEIDSDPLTVPSVVVVVYSIAFRREWIITLCHLPHLSPTPPTQKPPSIPIMPISPLLLSYFTTFPHTKISLFHYPNKY